MQHVTLNITHHQKGNWQGAYVKTIMHFTSSLFGNPNKMLNECNKQGNQSIQQCNKCGNEL